MISFDFSSVAICARTSRSSHDHALTMCRADFSLARVKGAAQRLAVDRNHAGRLLRKRPHELGETCAERCRIEKPEQPTERVVRRQTVLQRQEVPQERLLVLRELRHLRARRASARHEHERDHQHLTQVAPTSIPGARILELQKYP